MADTYLEITESTEVVQDIDEAATTVTVTETAATVVVAADVFDVTVDQGNVDVVTVGTQGPAGAQGVAGPAGGSAAFQISIDDTNVGSGQGNVQGALEYLKVIAGTGSSGGVSDHGLLTGLADDDHPQYALADGSRGSFEASGAVGAHEAALDPHPQYLTEAEGNVLYDVYGVASAASAALSASITAHLVDPTDAHDATAISIDDTILQSSETEVQGALEYLKDKVNKVLFVDYLFDSSVDTFVENGGRPGDLLPTYMLDAVFWFQGENTYPADRGIWVSTSAGTATQLSPQPGGQGLAIYTYQLYIPISGGGPSFTGSFQLWLNFSGGTASAASNFSPLVLDAEAIFYTPTNPADWVNPDPTAVQGALDDLAELLTPHLADVGDPHPQYLTALEGSASFDALGTGASVLGIANELSASLTAHINDPVAAHAATAISYDNTSASAVISTATEVQTAIDELADFTASHTGLSGTLYEYDADANTTSGNPGVRHILWNNSTMINATAIHINHLTSNNFDIDLLLQEINVGDRFLIQDSNLSDNYQYWIVNGTPSRIISGTPYWVFPVAFESSAGTGTTDFPNNHQLIVAVFREGALSAHLDDTADAHNASAISIDDSVLLSGETEVQGALEWLNANQNSSASALAASIAAIPVYTAGDGLTLTGADFDVNVDNSTIEINSDILRVKADGITDAHLNSTTLDDLVILHWME